MYHLSIDIETYSSVDLKKSGLYKYVQAPDFQILLLAYSWGDAVHCIDLTGDYNRQELRILREALQDPLVIKHAYNAPFEWRCFNAAGFDTPLEQWRDTMLHGLYCGYTAGLAATGEALGLPQDKKKLGTGASLIKTFCVPQKPTKNNGYRERTLPQHEPEKWRIFTEYCKQDVVTEMEIENRLCAYPVPDHEESLWQLDQVINLRGVRVDAELVNAAIDMGERSAEKLMAEAIEITGLNNPKSVKQLSKWFEEELDEEVPNLQKDTVKKLLESGIDNEKAERVLKLRQRFSKTSTKKYEAMAAAMGDDGRFRGAFQFYGANRTGRWAGRLVQVHNLPRNYLGTLDIARKTVRSGKDDEIELLYGNTADTLSQLIRTAFIPQDGHTFIVADFNAIEARVLAWLANEKWVMEVFATHGKIYEAAAAQMFGTPIDKIVKGNPEYELRQKGKVATLALGYQGSSGALIQMGALEQGLTEEELPEIVQRWRQTNKRIVDYWYAVENAALECVRYGNTTAVKGATFSMKEDRKNGHEYFTVGLPSGRELFYVDPFLSLNGNADTG